MHRNTKGESPRVANAKNCVRKTSEYTQLTTVATVDSTQCIGVGGGIFENLL